MYAIINAEQGFIIKEFNTYEEALAEYEECYNSSEFYIDKIQ